MSDLNLRPVRPEDAPWLVAEHIALYSGEYGFDDSFGVLVGQIVEDFFANFDPATEAGWIAELDGTPLGSIFCTQLSEDTAQLRLFFLVEKARGTGAAKRMLQTCMDFAMSRGYPQMRLWTHQSHTAACRLYRRFGWHCIESKPALSFGQQEVIETYVYRF